MPVLSEQELKQEILDILEGSPELRNPRHGFSCLYKKIEPEEGEASNCVIGRLLENHGKDVTPLVFDNEGVDGLYPNEYRGDFFDFLEEQDEEIERILTAAQTAADGPTEPLSPTWGEAAHELRLIWKMEK